MDLLKKLDEAIKSPVASYIKLLSQYKKNDDTIFCFVEGQEDIAFYSQYIERHYNSEVKYIICYGKDNVLQNHQSIDWNSYCKKRLLFFVDKDFDEYIKQEIQIDENLYSTDFYSIENFLVDDYVLKKFIRDNCFISDERIINDLIGEFRIQRKKFISRLTKISAWMIYCRKNSFEVNFSDFKLSDMFKIDTNGNLKKLKIPPYTSHFSYICNKTGTSHYDYKEIRKIYQTLLLESEPKNYIRGKYELFFMFIYIKHLTDKIVPELSCSARDYNKTTKNKIIRPKVTLQVKEENIFQILCNKVNEPESLNYFIKSRQQ